jgi:hypothetical protein
VLLAWVVAGLWGTTGLAAAPRSVVIFVADGLRAGSVNTEDAPTMAALRQRGVSFLNSLAVSDLYHAQRLGHCHRPLPRRYR